MIDWRSGETSVSSTASTSSTFSVQLGCQFSHLTGQSYFVLLEQNSIGISKLMLASRHFLACWARLWMVTALQCGIVSLTNYSWRRFSLPFQAILVLLACHSLQLLCLIPTVLIATAMAETHRFLLLTCHQLYLGLLHGLFPGIAASSMFWIMFSRSKLFGANPGAMWYYLHLIVDRWKYKFNSMSKVRKRMAPK